MLINIRNPEKYLSEPDALKNCGRYTSQYGRRIFAIGGKRALDAVMGKVKEALLASECEVEFHIMEGYPTHEKIIEYTILSYQFNADLIMGIGGGRVIDIAKAVGNYRSLPVVCIPTVATSAASWTSKTILYKNDGSYDFTQLNKNNSKLVIADTDIIRAAPKRYLIAGVLESLSYYFELEPLLDKYAPDIVLSQMISIAREMRTIINNSQDKLLFGELNNDDLQELIDCIIFLGGSCSSVNKGLVYRGFAHPFAQACSKEAATSYILYEEKVAYGLLVQFILKEKTDDFIENYAQFLKNCKSIFTFSSLEYGEDEIYELSKRVIRETPMVRATGFADDAVQITRAIQKADALLDSIAVKSDCIPRTE
ncbi:MAG: iron-containing alcohol dehydrogenase [Lachnospiraceae bacterium]|nr:iron-containing alcohol dehydrogenase [Lachnospiraceae bacterium]